MNKIGIFIFISWLSCFSSLHLLGEDIAYKLLPFREKIVLDGVDKEAVWRGLPFSSPFTLVRSRENTAPRLPTKFKAYSDRENLYFLIVLECDPSEPEKENKAKKTDQFVLYFSPNPEIDDHYRIFINLDGSIKDEFHPAKAGHGFPYSVSVDKGWLSNAKCAVSNEESLVKLEVQIPVESLGLKLNLFRSFGFNIHRKASYVEDGKSKVEDTSWSHVNGELWNSQKFGLIKGPLFEGLPQFTGENLADLDQMTNGMTALLKSLDIYYKATAKRKHHIPEGTEINGDIGNCDHVPMPQYSVKADGYLRFYEKLKYKPYKELGNHIIGKIYNAYKETKDARGQNYLLWNNLMSDDGVVYAYDKGFKMGFFESPRVPYNQSKNKFHLKDVTFQDALGQGFYDLSDLKDSLDKPEVGYLIEVLEGTLKFLHQDYVLVQNKDQYYWRVDAFEPYNPQPFQGELKSEDWPYLGQDILLLFMSLYRFDAEKARLFVSSMTQFSAFYTKNRLQISKRKGPHAIHNIYKLDHRMLSLALFAEEYVIEDLSFLKSWLFENLPKLYEDIPEVIYSVNGATRNSWSTQGVLEIYRLLKMKKEFSLFWNKSFEEALTPLGLHKGYRIQPMNFSSYPMYFDYAHKAFQSSVMKEDQLSRTLKKMFSLYGNPDLQRDKIKYARDLTAEQRNRPMWSNTPYDAYIEGVLPEGIYANGSAQAFYSIFGDYSVNEFFKTGEEHARYEYKLQYYQYTAPFQYHSDRYSYGQAESLCLATQEKAHYEKTDLVKEAEQQILTIRCTYPDLPKNSPSFGSVDITNIMFDRENAELPTNLKVTRVMVGEQEIPFRYYNVLEYDKMFSEKDKAKLVFGSWVTESKKSFEVVVIFEEKKFRQFFTLTESK